MDQEKITLDQIMSRTPRTGSGVSFDLTARNSSNNVAAPTAATSSAKESEAKELPKQFKATAIEHGPVDLSKAKPVDVHQILPSRQAEVSVENNPLMADLDAAVNREMNRISEFHEAIFKKQEEEYQAKEDAENVRTSEDSTATTVSKDEDDDLGLYDDDFDDSFVDNSHRISIEDTTASSTEASQATIYYKENDFNDKNSSGSEMTMNAVDVQVVNEEGLKVLDESKAKSIFTSDDDKNVSEIEPAKTEQSVESVEPSFRILDHSSNDDLFDDEEEETEADSTADAEDSEKILEDLKSEVKQKITPIRNKIDLTEFTIAKKSESAQKVMRLAVQKHRNVADWVMLAAERPISVTGLSGPEILKLNPENSTRNRLNTFRDMYRVIYEHLYDGNKPEFETWLKQVRFADLQHIYFALYMATFGGSNFLSYNCPNAKCNKVFIKDVEFKDMVKYADDSVKQKIQSILKLDTTSPSNDTYPVDLVQISDSYVFGLRAPSIWNVIIETASLSDKFLEKHGDLIDVVAYIDSIYYIDAANRRLVPIDTKPDPNDQAKSSARRIKVFYDIIQQLTSEEYFKLGAAIKEYDKSSEQLTYMIPACTCPYCATEIPANEQISPDAMLFTRHQLAAIGNM